MYSFSFELSSISITENVSYMGGGRIEIIGDYLTDDVSIRVCQDSRAYEC